MNPWVRAPAVHGLHTPCNRWIFSTQLFVQCTSAHTATGSTTTRGLPEQSKHQQQRYVNQCHINGWASGMFIIFHVEVQAGQPEGWSRIAHCPRTWQTLNIVRVADWLGAIFQPMGDGTAGHGTEWAWPFCVQAQASIGILPPPTPLPPAFHWYLSPALSLHLPPPPALAVASTPPTVLQLPPLRHCCGLRAPALLHQQHNATATLDSESVTLSSSSRSVSASQHLRHALASCHLCSFNPRTNTCFLGFIQQPDSTFAR